MGLNSHKVQKGRKRKFTGLKGPLRNHLFGQDAHVWLGQYSKYPQIEQVFFFFFSSSRE